MTQNKNELTFPDRYVIINTQITFNIFTNYTMMVLLMNTTYHHISTNNLRLRIGGE